MSDRLSSFFFLADADDDRKESKHENGGMWYNKRMEPKDAKQFGNYFLLALLLASLALVAYIFLPYLSVIVFAVVFAVVFRPLFRVLRKLVRYDWLAALITVLAAIVIVFVPFSFLVPVIFAQATHLYGWFTAGNVAHLGVIANDVLARHFDRFNIPRIDITSYITSYLSASLGWFVQNLWPFVGGLAQFALVIFLSMFGMFYLLKDGGALRNRISSFIPLEPQYSKRVIDRMERAIYSVVGGSVVVALIHGVEVIVGFWIFGVPNAAFWGSFAVIPALIPMLGTSIVNIPAIIYLFATGHTIGAIGLFVWWIVVSINGVDNALSPQLKHRGLNAPPFLILLSVLGGISVFGLIGFLIGPLALAFFFALMDIYPLVNGREPKAEARA